MQRVFRATLVLSATFHRTPNMYVLRRLLLLHLQPRPPPLARALSSSSKPTGPSTTTTAADDDNEDEWNEAWEAAWLPEDDLSARTRAPWESPDDVQLPDDPLLVDSEAKAFVEEMEERWDERRKGGKVEGRGDDHVAAKAGTRDPVEEYRLRKQRIHASMWMREIEKLEESRLHAADTSSAAAAEIDRLLDSCSEIFNSGNNDLNDMDIPGSAEFKMKPDGWETTSKTPDGNIWEVTQREEDILLQEFERRIAFCKFQISSFIKTHIFSRRRPIDGWKYMIEELGPNARKSKGSVQRLPAVSDPATQPFKEESAAPGSTLTPFKG